jgi:protein SCO1
VVLAGLLGAGSAAASRWGADYFPNVTLVNQDGQALRFYDDLLKDKTVAINVIYTRCPDECPLETARLAQLQRLLGERMGRDIVFYSISIDPEYDTPARLKAYMEKFGVGPGWQFLTGKPEDIRRVTKKLGLSRTSDAQNRDGHTASLMVGNVPAGQWMRHSAADNPRFLADSMGTFLGWRNAKPGKSYAHAQPIALEDGEYLFQSRCSGCHSLGKGDALGPDLLGVTQRRERAWLVRYIQIPDKVLASGDPIARQLYDKYGKVRMPNVSLGRSDVDAIVSYLEKRDTAPAQMPHDHHHHMHAQ